MELETGSILVGKVSGIAKFGAFITLPSGKSGLVHISEIANTFVGDIHDFMQDGQEVKVKVLNIDANGRINLSIKQAQEQRPQQVRRENSNSQQGSGGEPRPAFRPRTGNFRSNSAPDNPPKPQAPQESTFEDKLKKFMQDSDSKISDMKMYSEKRSSRRRNKS